MGRGSGRGSSGAGLGRRLADDGKRLELFEFALDVAYTAGGKMGRGSGGGVGSGSARIGGLADDGKRFHALGVVLTGGAKKNIFR